MKILVRWIATRIKIGINFLLDRVMDLSLFLLTWSRTLPGLIQRGVNTTAYFIGDSAWLLRDFPRLNAYQLKGDQWTVIFAGSQVGCLEVQHLLFGSQEVSQQMLPRGWLWKLPEQCASWLDARADLVVCEISRFCVWKPSAAYAFTGPDWVAQLLEIPASPDDLLVGRRIHGPRRRIRQGEKNGFSYRFTRSKEDFNYYYEHMYLPFVETKHGVKALTSPYNDLYNRWFKLGGLLLVTRYNQPVAGSLVIHTKDVCQGIEMGVLHNDPELLQAGINSILVWSTILWSHQKGAKQLDLGATHAWCENGSFDFKAQWGARVVRRAKITPNWTFLSRRLPDPLRERLNQIGKISELGGKFYCTYLPAEGPQNPDELSLNDRVQDALMHGLAGIALVQPGSIKTVTAASEQEA